MEHQGLLILGLLAAVTVLKLLADRLRVPYPILFVVGGSLLGFLPGLPEVHLDPELVLTLFLPPLLYIAAYFTSVREFRSRLRSITLLSVGLVLATTAVVAAVAHALVAGMPWGVAFALGAIVSPTDPLAATEIMRRLGAPRGVVNIVEGESLVNDAIALVVYRVAVGAVVGGSFSLAGASLEFVLSAAGGVAVGLAVGWLVSAIRRRIEDAPVEITVSLATGYAAFLPAEQLHVSGVLAAVTAGMYVGWRGHQFTAATTRIQSQAVWETVSFVLNAVLFVLLGLQLPQILGGTESYSASTLAVGALLVSVTVIGTRLVWNATVPYAAYALELPGRSYARTSFQERLVISWSGLRGAVSLAAALALPEDFPLRGLIVFLTWAVIMATLVLQGLTLPSLIRALGVGDADAEEHEEIRARLKAAQAALGRLEELERESWPRPDTLERMRGFYDFRLRRFAARADSVGAEEHERDSSYDERSITYQRMVGSVIAAQRDEIVRLRNDGEISNEVMHRIQRELDLEESRLEI